MTIASPLPLALGALIFSLACSTSSDETTQTILASTGGTLELQDSRLVIPGNALEVDTEITLRFDAMSDHEPLEGADQVLSMEPAGLSLAVPARLTLHLGSEDDRPGSTVHYFTDGVWLPMETGQISGGGLEVTISNLGSFAVVPPRDEVGGNAIKGTITWPSGDPVSSAPIDLWRGDSHLVQIESDASGAFFFGDLAPGIYRVVVDYECRFEDDVSVVAETPTLLDISLCN